MSLLNRGKSFQFFAFIDDFVTVLHDKYYPNNVRIKIFKLTVK
jgi:hypothetical protein